jgi:hypothetical protein
LGLSLADVLLATLAVAPTHRQASTQVGEGSSSELEPPADPPPPPSTRTPKLATEPEPETPEVERMPLDERNPDEILKDLKVIFLARSPLMPKMTRASAVVAFSDVGGTASTLISAMERARWPGNREGNG